MIACQFQLTMLRGDQESPLPLRSIRLINASLWPTAAARA